MTKKQLTIIEKILKKEHDKWEHTDIYDQNYSEVSVMCNILKLAIKIIRVLK